MYTVYVYIYLEKAICCLAFEDYRLRSAIYPAELLQPPYKPLPSAIRAVIRAVDFIAALDRAAKSRWRACMGTRICHTAK